MSSISLPPIRSFYDESGTLKERAVYSYLNSLFGGYGLGSKHLKLHLPSLAVPSIFEGKTQTVLTNAKGYDPNIQPFILYYFFNNVSVSHKVQKNWSLMDGSIIKEFNYGGRFVFIVPQEYGGTYESKSRMRIFSRQSSIPFLSAEDLFVWAVTPANKSDSRHIKMIQGQYALSPDRFYVGSKLFPTYKSLSPQISKDITLNFSKRGFLN